MATTKNNNNKHTVLTDEDIKIIEGDPAGLADYVVRNKLRSARKTMIIITILAVAASFAFGVITGMGWTRESIPNNVVQIEIGDKTTVPAAAVEAETEAATDEAGK